MGLPVPSIEVLEAIEWNIQYWCIDWHKINIANPVRRFLGFPARLARKGQKRERETEVNGPTDHNRDLKRTRIDEEFDEFL